MPFHMVIALRRFRWFSTTLLEAWSADFSVGMKWLDNDTLELQLDFGPERKQPRPSIMSDRSTSIIVSVGKERSVIRRSNLFKAARRPIRVRSGDATEYLRSLPKNIRRQNDERIHARSLALRMAFVIARLHRNSSSGGSDRMS